MKVQLDESKIKEKITRVGKFTIAELLYEPDIGKRVLGVGIARQGAFDRFRPEVGISIARARARKAIDRKLKGKIVNDMFAG
jgi:hypothetical protein